MSGFEGKADITIAGVCFLESSTTRESRRLLQRAAIPLLAALRTALVALLKHPDLAADEARLYREVVASCHPDHFVMTDTHLIAAYVQAVLMVRRLAKEKKTDQQAVPLWETACKVEVMFARTLRLTPRSRITPRTAGRMASLRPWEER